MDFVGEIYAGAHMWMLPVHKARAFRSTLTYRPVSSRNKRYQQKLLPRSASVQLRDVT